MNYKYESEVKMLHMSLSMEAFVYLPATVFNFLFPREFPVCPWAYVCMSVCDVFLFAGYMRNSCLFIDRFLFVRFLLFLVCVDGSIKTPNYEKFEMVYNVCVCAHTILYIGLYRAINREWTIRYTVTVALHSRICSNVFTKTHTHRRHNHMRRAWSGDRVFVDWSGARDSVRDTEREKDVSMRFVICVCDKCSQKSFTLDTIASVLKSA